MLLILWHFEMHENVFFWGMGGGGGGWVPGPIRSGPLKLFLVPMYVSYILSFTE